MLILLPAFLWKYCTGRIHQVVEPLLSHEASLTAFFIFWWWLRNIIEKNLYFELKKNDRGGEGPFFAHQIGLIAPNLQVAVSYWWGNIYHLLYNCHPLHPTHSHHLHLHLDLRFRLTSINSTFCIYTGERGQVEWSRSTNKQTKCQSKAQHTNTKMKICKDTE